MNGIQIKTLLLSALLSLACTTKVSEWVLVNASAGRYTLVYFYNDQINETVMTRNAALSREISNANIDFRTVERKGIEKPWYALYYGNRLFERYDDPKDLTGLIVSPIRQKIASEIMAGKLCVLTYLTTGNKEKDDRGMQIIRNALNDSPFKNIITVTELNRNEPGESHFVSMLLNVEADLKTIPEPMLFGVFGRFRALEPLLGKGITEENIKLMIDFFTADCSCVIKDDLPGIDILFTDNWENPSTAMVNRILDENPDLQHH